MLPRKAESSAHHKIIFFLLLLSFLLFSFHRLDYVEAKDQYINQEGERGKGKGEGEEIVNVGRYF